MSHWKPSDAPPAFEAADRFLQSLFDLGDGIERLRQISAEIDQVGFDPFSDLAHRMRAINELLDGAIALRAQATVHLEQALEEGDVSES